VWVGADPDCGEKATLVGLSTTYFVLPTPTMITWNVLIVTINAQGMLHLACVLGGRTSQSFQLDTSLLNLDKDLFTTHTISDRGKINEEVNSHL